MSSPTCSRVTPSTSLSSCCQVRRSPKHEGANASVILVELHRATLGKDLHLSPSGLSWGFGMMWGTGGRLKEAAGAVGLGILFVPVQISQQVMGERHEQAR